MTVHSPASETDTALEREQADIMADITVSVVNIAHTDNLRSYEK